MILDGNGNEIYADEPPRPHRFGHFVIPPNSGLVMGDGPRIGDEYKFVPNQYADIRKEDTERRT